MRTHLLLSLSLLGLTLACREDAEAPTAPGPSPALATTASALVFTQVCAGTAHTCGVALDTRIYCWGLNNSGQLGDGTTTTRLVPVPVATTLRFRQVSAGDHSTCAITTASSATGGQTFAMCWGAGPLGGFAFASPTPVFVKSGLPFRQVQVGFEHACAVTPDDSAYCWGNNFSGQLGGGDGLSPGPVPSSSTPISVIGSHKFRHVATGYRHTCGVTTDNGLFCWGSNHYGSVGDSSTSEFRSAPTRVAGKRQYHQVDVGRDYSCAVTLAGRAFCWGAGLQGQLGNGLTKNARYPRPVSSSLSFGRVTAGDFHACAETTTGNRTYCWGPNSAGELGDGTTTDRLTPVRVVGGLFFNQVSAGGEHTCGKTSAGRAYCWGFNNFGQLGNGTTDNSATPTPVAGP